MTTPSPLRTPPLLLTPRDMARLTGGRWHHLPDAGLALSGIHFYLPYVAEGDLFVYRQREGATPEDAQMALRKAFAQGASAAMVPAGVAVADRPHLVVRNIDKALQDLAAGASLKFDGRRVLITGSHGKTGFKNQLFHLIRRQLRAYAYHGSANKEVPVLRTLAALPQDTDVALIEVAVPAAKIGPDRAFFVRPDFCVITGIGPEHLKSHKTMENLVRNKASVVTGLRPDGKVLLNADDRHFQALAAAVRAWNPHCPILTFGSAPNCDGRLIAAEFSDWRWHVRAEVLGEEIAYDLPLLERYAPLASVGVLLQAKLLGADLAACVAEYATYRHYQSSGNLYRVPQGNGHFFVYDQGTRAELHGFESMFELMARLQPAPGGRKIVVMSELFDIDDNPGVTVDYDHMRALIAQAGIDRLYTLARFDRHRDVLPPGLKPHAHGDTPDDIKASLLAEVRANDLLFLRGDPPLRLDRLTKALIAHGSGPAEPLY